MTRSVATVSMWPTSSTLKRNTNTSPSAATRTDRGNGYGSPGRVNRRSCIEVRGTTRPRHREPASASSSAFADAAGTCDRLRRLATDSSHSGSTGPIIARDLQTRWTSGRFSFHARGVPSRHPTLTSTSRARRAARRSARCGCPVVDLGTDSAKSGCLDRVVRRRRKCLIFVDARVLVSALFGSDAWAA
jgi:hypothetical protein